MKTKILRYWKSIFALILLLLAFKLEYLNFYFAVIYFIWVVQGIRYREAFFLDNIPKSESPLLFWIISIFWIALAIFSLLFSEPVLKWVYRGF